MPEDLSIPVQDATKYDWNKDTFWDERWGRSGVHKGIDIFSRLNKPVRSSSYGIVIYKANLALGGNVISVLGPKWRIHYYAHLNQTHVSLGSVVKRNDILGTVGNTGNAKGKPPHLHYSIISLLPHFWRADDSMQGWKKMFFLNPAKKLAKAKSIRSIMLTKNKKKSAPGS
ncbi:MAG: M23 family metallopeptidase [Gammaproteobacteria bacterium]|nr:M23 family metallopeptidase [Gammaproteobacteria bacterium]MDH5777844.1 M23 family metallopeptidase [Gammaproteobacteria bacterium]